MNLPLAALPFRAISYSACAAALTVGSTAYVSALLLLARRFGAPADWPPRWRYGMAAAAVIGSCVWWWINHPMEGNTLINFRQGHALTDGDLLAVPALASAVILCLPGRRTGRSTGSAPARDRVGAVDQRD